MMTVKRNAKILFQCIFYRWFFCNDCESNNKLTSQVYKKKKKIEKL